MSATLAEHLAALAAHFQCPLTADERTALLQFAGLVAQWNRRINLTGARTDAQLAEVLFADALVLRGPDLIGDDQAIVDVGAGAGAPAIPLSVLRPDLRLSCVEPLRKRVAFLRTAVGHLKLGARVEVVEGRGDQLRGRLRVDVAMSRATFEPAQWAALGATLARSVLVFTAREEPPDLPGLVRVATRRYTVPRTGAGRCIAVYRAQ